MAAKTEREVMLCIIIPEGLADRLQMAIDEYARVYDKHPRYVQKLEEKQLWKAILAHGGAQFVKELEKAETHAIVLEELERLSDGVD